jgi:hypothetical protein
MRKPKTRIRRPTQTTDSGQDEPTCGPDSELCQRIRETAYYKWEAAGSPCSDGVEFWLQAEAEIVAEEKSHGAISKQ